MSISLLSRTNLIQLTLLVENIEMVPAEHSTEFRIEHNGQDNNLIN